MDMRVKKTEDSIEQAFLDLRRQKPLEKITVKELCQRAAIHKSTFYGHYEDLYALSDALETQVVEQVIFGLHHPEYVFERPSSPGSCFRAIGPRTSGFRSCSPAAGRGGWWRRWRRASSSWYSGNTRSMPGIRTCTSFSATRSTGATTPISAAGTSPGSR